MKYAERIAVFDEIRVKPGKIEADRIMGTVTVSGGGSTREFELIFSYGERIEADMNTAGLILTMPAINFTLFSRRLVLDFPASDQDLKYIGELVRTNNREVFINKLARRRYEFFKPEFVPTDADITADNIDGITILERTEIMEEHGRTGLSGSGGVAVLSSGGKESLLSFGMLRESGADTHAYFFNESGGHWRTARTSYLGYSEMFENVHRVWSNVDRFYRFLIRELNILDQAAVRRRADTYPVQLFIFPVYLMALMPLAVVHGISSAVIGDEFDDPREMPEYRGFRHYYGIYDQTHDFNSLFTEYMHSRNMEFSVWSAVYPVSGSVVEKVLLRRYPELFRLQRSCHSCRNVNGQSVPCGKCSKCLGIIMFVKAAGGDPAAILYPDYPLEELKGLVEGERMRLDSDELTLMKARLGISGAQANGLEHVDGIHILPDESVPFEKVPGRYRDSIAAIIGEYCPGTYVLKNGEWKLQDQEIRKIQPRP